MTFDKFTNLPVSEKIEALRRLYKGEIKFDSPSDAPFGDMPPGFNDIFNGIKK